MGCLGDYIPISDKIGYGDVIITIDLLLRLLLTRKGDFLAGGGNTEEEG